MKITKDELIQLLDKQRELELEASQSLSSLSEMSKNNIVKLLLIGVIHDSKKHAQILEAMINLTQTNTFGNVEKFEISRGVDKHIEIEEEMRKKLDDIIAKAEDKQVKAFLEQIASEEKRHHQSLSELKEIIEHAKKITEDEIWDYLNRWSNFST